MNLHIFLLFGLFLNAFGFLRFKQSTCDVLALSGGGSFGAVEAGILDDLLTTKQIPETYDIITGISAGGLNVGYLSYYSNMTDAIPEMFSMYNNTKNEDIYERDLLKIMDNWSIYDTTPLKNTLTKYLTNKVADVNHPITLVGSSNVLKQELDVFRFDTLNINDKIDVLMATSAIPIVFPPHTINGSLYVDGGVISNEMIFEAMGSKNCDYYNFVFLSASQHKENTQTIDGLFSYTSAVMKLIYNTFDYQLSEFESITCNNPRGTIKACFPNSTLLEQYSILDFDNGAVLYNIGKSQYTCKTIPLC